MLGQGKYKKFRYIRFFLKTDAIFDKFRVLIDKIID